MQTYTRKNILKSSLSLITIPIAYRTMLGLEEIN